MGCLRVGPLAAALVLVCASSALAGPQDGLIPVNQYTSAKAKELAVAHQTELLKLSEYIYHCLPWLGVVKNGIGFPHPKGADGDDRYLSVWVNIDQEEDPRFGALTMPRRASAMFSRYGVFLLRRMTRFNDITTDTNVQGFSVVLSWLKPGSLDNGSRPVMETLALFVDKPSLDDFLAKRIKASDFTERAKYNLFDGKTLVGRVPLEVWEDNFNSTFKLKNYEIEKGQHC
jgi:hypothetical protein